MKAKRATWLIFYRTKSGKLSNHEVSTKQVMKNESMPDMVMEFDVSKEEAMYAVSKRRGFFDFERMADGTPIVKRMEYV